MIYEPVKTESDQDRGSQAVERYRTLVLVVIKREKDLEVLYLTIRSIEQCQPKHKQNHPKNMRN